MALIHVAATQMSCSIDRDENISKAESLVRDAASRGAQIILLQELFELPYFCQVQEPQFLTLAGELENSRAVRHFCALAKDLNVVLPISFYEKKNQAQYNSAAVIDANGTILGVYRKTHIPDGPGYQEKYYFSPGDTGFPVWETRFARIGLGICWDQWFPETARCLVLSGAQILLFPTAIGSEPLNPGYDSKDHWQICMRGHAAANMVPVVASNRVGSESIGASRINFYGSSFIADHQGRILAEADRSTEGVIVAQLDLDFMEAERRAWGLFRDRRPEHYRKLLSMDGQ